MMNPLNQYFRIPKLYVKLPSQGTYYPDHMVETSAQGEVAVHALTAMDQILLKTPDAVLNGETLLQIFRNCVPGVKDPSQLVEPDINTLMVAIRVASAGSTMEWNTKCAKCDQEHTFDVDLTPILETQSFIEDSAPVDLNGELLVHVRPYNFKQRHMQLMNDLEHNQAVRMLDSRTDISEPDRQTQVAQIIRNITERTFELLAQSVVSVTVVNTQQVVTDPDHICEFVKNISKSQADVIIEEIKSLNQMGIDTTSRFTCTACGNAWDQPLDFDPTSFFD
jgi:hypothetical protein